MVEFKARKKNKEVESCERLFAPISGLFKVLYWFCNSPSSGHPWFHCYKTPCASSTELWLEGFLFSSSYSGWIFFFSQPLGKKNGTENIGFCAQHQKLLRSLCYWWESLCRNSMSLHAFLRIQTGIRTECCDSKIVNQRHISVRELKWSVRSFDSFVNLDPF